MFIRCQVGDEVYDRWIQGRLVNPEQMIQVSGSYAHIEGSSLLSVTPVKDTDVEWVDRHGGKHTSRLLKGHPFAVDAKFIAS